jgi:hypothetical protein
MKYVCAHTDICTHISLEPVIPFSKAWELWFWFPRWQGLSVHSGLWLCGQPQFLLNPPTKSCSTHSHSGSCCLSTSAQPLSERLHVLELGQPSANLALTQSLPGSRPRCPWQQGQTAESCLSLFLNLKWGSASEGAFQFFPPAHLDGSCWCEGFLPMASCGA